VVPHRDARARRWQETNGTSSHLVKTACGETSPSSSSRPLAGRGGAQDRREIRVWSPPSGAAEGHTLNLGRRWLPPLDLHEPVRLLAKEPSWVVTCRLIAADKASAAKTRAVEPNGRTLMAGPCPPSCWLLLIFIPQNGQ
jgi:hypothetical protein